MSFSFGGSSTFGATPTATPQAQPQQQQQQNNNTAITEKTVFEDLPADAQNVLIQQQELMRQQEDLYEEIAQHSYTPIKEIAKNIQSQEEQLVRLKEVLEMDSHTVQEFNARVRKQMKEADQQLRAAARCSNAALQVAPPSSLPSQYFWTLLHDFEVRLQQHKRQIDDIENALSTSNTAGIDPAVIGEILLCNNDTFLSVASKVAELHKKLQAIKQELRKQQKDDPFQTDKEREEPKKTFELPPVPLSSLNQTNNTQTPSTGGGLFGGGSTSTGSTFNFGSTTSTPTSTSTFGGFGSNTGSTSLFGNKTASTTSTGSSAFSFGNSSTPLKSLRNST